MTNSARGDARLVRRSAQSIAVLVLVAVAVVAVWAWSRDEDAEKSLPAGHDEPELDDLDGIGEALRCDSLDEDFGMVVLEARADSAACLVDGEPIAGIHLARNADAHDSLLSFFRQRTQGTIRWPPCPGESSEEQAERFAFWLIAGGRWLVTTRDPAIRQRALDMGGEETDFSPGDEPPGSYGDIGGADCPPSR